MEGFKFNLGDPVLNVETGVEGKVMGLWLDEIESHRYQVRYVDSVGRIAEYWFYEQELQLAL